MQFVTQNPRKVLEMLGLDPDAVGATFYQSNIRKSHTMPEKNPKYNNNNHQSDEEAVDELKEKLCPFFWDSPKKSDALQS